MQAYRRAAAAILPLPEAEVARATYRATRKDLQRLIRESISGRQLIDGGFIEDVELALAQDVSAAEANLIHATQGAVRGANFEQPVTFAAWTSKPSWYIVAAQDRMIDPGAQRALAKKIRATTVELQTSHVPMVSDPASVAKVIVEAARAAAK